MALGQSLGWVESVFRQAGLSWRVPDFSTVCRRQKDLSVMQPHQLQQIPPGVAIASVGGDGAYDTKASHASVVVPGAMAIIPQRKGA